MGPSAHRKTESHRAFFSPARRTEELSRSRASAPSSFVSWQEYKGCASSTRHHETCSFRPLGVLTSSHGTKQGTWREATTRSNRVFSLATKGSGSARRSATLPRPSLRPRLPKLRARTKPRSLSLAPSKTNPITRLKRHNNSEDNTTRRGLSTHRIDPAR